MKRVRESARIKELSENGKKYKMYKIEVGPTVVERALNDIFYDSFRVKKHAVVKSRGMIVENCFFEESLTKIGLVDFLVSARLLNSACFAKEYSETLVHEFYANLDEDIYDVGSSFHDLVYVRKEVVDFHVEELSAFLGIPFYHDIEGSDLGETKVTKKMEADIRKSKEVEARFKPPLKSIKSKQPIHVSKSIVDHQNYVHRIQF
ncbi:hypothetical protein M9H77_08378 [Catharanthus roseus]|uniref:Uncharacterized protein n=1 Tax=Catharanthus roseus TaxID=4058 RepID=A0ACC0BY13_CATRO|nr:hypothetical protein M9H77_08378 [Catharanthus roseus]